MIGLIQNTTCIESDVRDMIYASYFGEKIKVVADTSDQFDLYLKVKVTGDQVAFSLIQDEQVIMEESCTGISRDPVKTALYRLDRKSVV